MNFELPNWTQAKINNINVRSEKHGDDFEPAVDLSISIEQPNSCLSEFHGALLSALYFKSAASVDQQAQLDGVEPVADMPNLRFTHLSYPLRWDYDRTGYSIEIDHGMGGKSNIKLSGCAVNNFQITPKEGGTVEIKFRVQYGGEDLTEKTLGKLAMLAQHTVPILLLAPDTDGQQHAEPELDPSGCDQPDELTPERALEDALATA